MEKLVYLVRDSEERAGSDLRDALIEKAVPEICAAAARDIIVNVQDEDVAAGTPIRQSSGLPIRAVVTFWMQCADDRESCEAALRGVSQGIDGYLVAESRPMLHEVNRGGRSPGMNQITCIARTPGMPDADFFGIWHGSHKEVAKETQSTTGYVRNVVTRTLTEDAPPFDGIVEETFPMEALTDPHVFYDAVGDEARFKENVDRMMKSCERFLDFAPMECTHMSEYVLD